jgi:hypothetical protein
MGFARPSPGFSEGNVLQSDCFFGGLEIEAWETCYFR